MVDVKGKSLAELLTDAEQRTTLSPDAFGRFRTEVQQLWPKFGNLLHQVQLYVAEELKSKPSEGSLGLYAEGITERLKGKGGIIERFGRVMEYVEQGDLDVAAGEIVSKLLHTYFRQMNDATQGKFHQIPDAAIQSTALYSTEEKSIHRRRTVFRNLLQRIGNSDYSLQALLGEKYERLKGLDHGLKEKRTVREPDEALEELFAGAGKREPAWRGNVEYAPAEDKSGSGFEDAAAQYTIEAAAANPDRYAELGDNADEVLGAEFKRELGKQYRLLGITAGICRFYVDGKRVIVRAGKKL